MRVHNHSPNPRKLLRFTKRINLLRKHKLYKRRVGQVNRSKLLGLGSTFINWPYSYLQRCDLRHLIIIHANFYPFLSFNKKLDKFHFAFFKDLKLFLFWACMFRMSFFIYGTFFAAQWEDYAETPGVFWQMSAWFVSFFSLGTFACSAAAYAQAKPLEHLIQTFWEFNKFCATRQKTVCGNKPHRKTKLNLNCPSSLTHSSLFDMDQHRSCKITLILLFLIWDAAVVLFVCCYFYLFSINLKVTISPFEFCFTNPTIGKFCRVAEVIYTVPCIIYAPVSVIVFGIIFCPCFYSALIFLKDLDMELHKDGVTVRHLEKVLRLRTWFSRYIDLLNEAMKTIIIPFLQFVPICCTVTLNWLMIRVLFEQGLHHLSDLIIALFCAVSVNGLNLCVIIIFYGAHRITRGSSKIISEIELQRRLFLLREQNPRLIRRLRVLEAELRAQRPICVENCIDGPITNMADVYYVMHVMDYTISALLFFH